MSERDRAGGMDLEIDAQRERDVQLLEAKIEEVKDEIVFAASTLEQVQTTLLDSFQNTKKAKKAKNSSPKNLLSNRLGSTLGAAGSAIKGKLVRGIDGELAGQAELWPSPTTLGWLKTVQQERLEQRGPEANVIMVWALVFAMPPDIEHTVTEDDDGDAAGELKNHHPISHEAWLIVERLRACDFKLEHSISLDGTQLIIRVGAPKEVLINEAHHTRIQMRLQETKGQLEFHQDLLRFYATNHGGLNEFKMNQWVRRDPTKAANWAKVDVTADQAKSAGSAPVEERREQEVVQKGVPVGQASERMRRRALMESRRSVFTSGLAQRLVLSRMKRVGLVNLEQYMGAGQPEDLLRFVKKRCTGGGDELYASKLSELLLVHGAMRPDHKSIFPPNERGEAVVSQLGGLLQMDPDFVLRPNQLLSHIIPKEKAVTYKLVNEVCDSLKKWRAPNTGPGREETFCGTLQHYLPIHDDEELAYLADQWGNFRVLLKANLVGYNPEGPPTVLDRGPPQLVEQNTFGSDLNIPHEHAIPWSWAYQPIEEVRDYFGDEVALYFSWLGMYTSALAVNAVFGIGVMILQPIFGGVDNNPMTVTYSVYVGLWSITFLSTWGRRENELRFLWGTAGLSTKEDPRLEFSGEVVYNPDTGRTFKVPASMWRHRGKRVLSVLVVLFMMVATTLAATGATLLRYIEDDDTRLFSDFAASSSGIDKEAKLAALNFFEIQWLSKKYVVLSAATNLVIIIAFGIIFELVAQRLTDYENHRTESDYSNSLVVKNFCFQFVNNYFVLFYIGYMREIPDPFTSEAHPCDTGSCLPELQTQMFIVFTAKTIGKQIANFLKPFAFSALQLFKANKNINKLISNAQLGIMNIPNVSIISNFVPTSDNLLRDDDDDDDDKVGAMLGGLRITDPTERQIKRMPFESTFDYFNDRSIQFGYVVLFAPAYPLAPFWALINNIIEIRSQAYQMCHGFRRPVWKARESIGSWFIVLNVLGFLAVITNASMIAFVGSQQSRNPWFGDSDLSGPVCRIGAYSLKTRCGGASTVSKRMDYAELWMAFMLIEHGLLCLRVLILALSPTMPAWVRSGEETLVYRTRHVFKTRDQLEVEQRAKDQYMQKLHDHRNRIKERMQLTREEMKQKFKQIDLDESGMIDKREINLFFESVGLELTEEEMTVTVNDMDEDVDVTVGTEISFIELGNWLIRSGLWDPESVDNARRLKEERMLLRKHMLKDKVHAAQDRLTLLAVGSSRREQSQEPRADAAKHATAGGDFVNPLAQSSDDGPAKTSARRTSKSSSGRVREIDFDGRLPSPPSNS